MENAILAVDDEPNVLSALTRIFLDEPVRVFTAGSAQEALEILKTGPVKVIVSDERMPVMSGSELLSIVRRDHPDTVRIMLTGHASMDAAMKAINEGEIYRFFLKPWNDIELRFAVRSAIEKFDLESENRRLLATVKKQAIDMKLLEIQFPGITEIRRDADGRVVLSDLSEAELSKIVEQCEKEFS